MAITKAKKQEVLGKLQGIAKSPAATFVNFHGLTMPESNELRSALRQNGVKYVVAKKTLVKKAFTEAGHSGEIPTLDGELAVAYADDLLAPAREVYAFEKKFDKKIAILGGVFDGSFKNKEEMVSIAQIPGKQVLLGMFVNLLNSPIQGIAIALDAIAAKKEA